jgi:hypothetical protein
VSRIIAWQYDALYKLAWFDVAADAEWPNETEHVSRCPSEWAEAIACLGWCLHDAGALAAAARAEADSMRAQQAAVIKMAADIRADLDATARAVAADVVAENEHLRACLADCRAALAAKGT